MSLKVHEEHRWPHRCGSRELERLLYEDTLWAAEKRFHFTRSDVALLLGKPASCIQFNYRLGATAFSSAMDSHGRVEYTLTNDDSTLWRSLELHAKATQDVIRVGLDVERGCAAASCESGTAGFIARSSCNRLFGPVEVEVGAELPTPTLHAQIKSQRNGAIAISASSGGVDATAQHLLEIERIRTTLFGLARYNQRQWESRFGFEKHISGFTVKSLLINLNVLMLHAGITHSNVYVGCSWWFDPRKMSSQGVGIVIRN